MKTMKRRQVRKYLGSDPQIRRRRIFRRDYVKPAMEILAKEIAADMALELSIGSNSHVWPINLSGLGGIRAKTRKA